MVRSECRKAVKPSNPVYAKRKIDIATIVTNIFALSLWSLQSREDLQKRFRIQRGRWRTLYYRNSLLFQRAQSLWSDRC